MGSWGLDPVVPAAVPGSQGTALDVGIETRSPFYFWREAFHTMGKVPTL
jgi:hypothetical protein